MNVVNTFCRYGLKLCLGIQEMDKNSSHFQRNPNLAKEQWYVNNKRYMGTWVALSLSV